MRPFNQGLNFNQVLNNFLLYSLYLKLKCNTNKDVLSQWWMPSHCVAPTILSSTQRRKKRTKRKNRALVNQSFLNSMVVRDKIHRHQSTKGKTVEVTKQEGSTNQLHHWCRVSQMVTWAMVHSVTSLRLYMITSVQVATRSRDFVVLRTLCTILTRLRLRRQCHMLSLIIKIIWSLPESKGWSNKKKAQELDKLEAWEKVDTTSRIQETEKARSIYGRKVHESLEAVVTILSKTPPIITFTFSLRAIISICRMWTPSLN